jgi:hypothetical protein
MIEMKVKNAYFLVLVFCIILTLISVFPLDSRLPGGTDVTSHLFKVWYISKYGITDWNPFWYGGVSFLRFYPPLFYIISGYLAKIIGYLIAYKLVIDLFYVLTPLVFYYFLNEFKFSEKQKSISLLVFSLIPIYHYYFSDGRHPSLVALFFGIIFWIFLKRAIEKKKYIKELLLCSTFLSLCLLSHHLVFVLLVPITFLWAIFYLFKIKTIVKFLEIGFLCSLLTIWWWGPFLIESSESVEEGHEYLKIIESDVSIGKILRSIISMWRYYSFSWSEYVMFSLVGLLGVLCLLSLFKRTKIISSFFVIFVFSLVLLVFVSYKRIFVLIPIPLSILASHGLIILKKKIQVIITLLLLILTVTSYFSIRTDIYSFPVPPNIPKNGRVIALPAGEAFRETEKDTKYKVEDLVFPLHGNEFILGWYPQAISVGKYGVEKLDYDNTLSDPSKVKPNEYYQLLKDGWVNYVVVRKDKPEFINYFNSSNNFTILNTTEKFLVFEMIPKSTYVEMNGKSIKADVKKNDDKILINMICKPGNITVKETYNQNWVATINEKRVELNGFEQGFMQLKSNEDGPCIIKLNFENPLFYSLFGLISILTAGFIIIFLVLKLGRNK